MSGRVLSLAPGSRLVFDGEVAEVVAIDGVRVTLRNDRTRRFTAVQISRLAASARPGGGTEDPALLEPSAAALAAADRDGALGRLTVERADGLRAGGDTPLARAPEGPSPRGLQLRAS